MGNTAILCSVHGPAEGRSRGDGAGGAAGSAEAIVEVDVNIAGFAGVDRKRRAGGSDRYYPYDVLVFLRCTLLVVSWILTG